MLLPNAGKEWYNGVEVITLLKVFLVEDECVVREGLRDCIDWERYGFEFCGDAPDGELALPQIRKLRPDILITDIKMPFMDGLALSKLVCAELPETRIILISGHNDFEFAQEAIEIGVEQYLLKPVTKSSLLKTLEDPGQLETWRQEVQAKVDELRQELREAALRISGSVNQRLEELNRDVTEKLQTLQSVFDSVSGNLSALGDKLTRYQEAIQSTGTTLSGAIQLSSTLRGDLGQLAQDMDRIVTSDGFRRFVEVLENDPEGLADYLSDPVSMETVPVYEITSYGSSMAPYYIMLALFVGSLLTATMLHVNAPMPELFRLRPWQRFFGRYQLFFLIGMIQALVTGLGCIYYIGIQCPYPGLFLLACCVCSLNFTMMNYALVYALDNIGMAASVIIMVIQVAGSGGVYPIDVLPGIFQTLYKFMPFHYGMDMLRETIAGRYENVYWKNLAVMAAMCVLFAVLGMVLYYPARPLNRLIARSKEKSGIM